MENDMTRIAKMAGRVRRYAAWTAASALLLGAVAACKDTLKVTNPQSFTTEALSQSELADALAHAGLSFDRHLGQDSSWLLARPTSIEQQTRRRRLHERAP